MKAQPQNTSICQTCVYVSECIHHRNSQIACKPIWFCENFDNRPPPHAVENEKIYSVAQASQSSKSDIETIPGRMKGLCINCYDRALCKLPVRDGGVWYCEEYR